MSAATYVVLLTVAVTASAQGAAYIIDWTTSAIEDVIGEAPLPKPPIITAAVSPARTVHDAAAAQPAAIEPARQPVRAAGGRGDPASRFYSGDGDTYRTVCVRLCDGYFWTVSFSTTDDRFEQDSATCARSCGQQVRLFTYKVPGGRPEDMEDLSGRPYAKLKTAFLFRSRFDASCRCKPDPWSAEASMQHRLYALQDAARKGDATARREHAELKTKLEALTPAVAVASVDPADAPAKPVPKTRTAATSSPTRAERAAASAPPGRMSLGGPASHEPARPARHSGPASRFRDWRVRAFEGQ
ncbi:MAG TPA: DUF2865 domain-containing protein [Hyphomicrobiaceae bacterium]|nr:DUF2865 domain-containing protein [Hyphomicrobiaceae bacterium]